MPPRLQICFLVIYFFEASIYILFSHSRFNWKGFQMTPFLGSSGSLLLGLQEGCDVPFHEMSIKCCGHTSNGRFWRGWLIDDFYETDCNSVICHSESLTTTATITTTHHPPPPQSIYCMANMNEKPKTMGFLSWINITC